MVQRKALVFITVVCLVSILMYCSEKKEPVTKPDSSRPQPTKVIEPSGELAQLVNQLTQGAAKRNNARRAIIKLGKGATDDLLTFSESSEYVIRWEIANILGHTKDTKGLDTLKEYALYDKNPHVKWRSIWALQRFKDPTIAERFKKELINNSEAVRWNAALVCAMVGDREVIPTIHKGFESEDNRIVWEAIKALAFINEPGSVSYLRKVLSGTNKKLRRESINSLGNMDYPEARDLLIDSLTDEDDEVRKRSAARLSSFKEDSVRKALQKRLKSESNKQVLQQLEKSLEKLEAK